MKSMTIAAIAVCGLVMASPAFAQVTPKADAKPAEASKPRYDGALPIEIRPAPASAEPLTVMVTRPVNDCPAPDDTSVTMPAACVAKLLKKN